MSDEKKGFFKTIGGAIGSFAEKIADSVGNTVTTGTGILSNATEKVGNLVEDGLDLVSEGAKKVPIVGPVVGGTLEYTGRTVSKAFKVGGSVVSGAGSGVSGIVSGGTRIIGGALSGDAPMIKQGLKDNASGVSGGAIIIVGKTLSLLQSTVFLESKGRKLSLDEQGMIRQVFGDSIDLSNVRIVEGNSGIFELNARQFALGNTIYLKNRHLDPTLLIHEITHVWQFQHIGARYSSDALGAQLFMDEAYDWKREVRRGKQDWLDFNLESQASLLEELYDWYLSNKSVNILGKDRRFTTDNSGLINVENFVSEKQDFTDLFRGALREVRRARKLNISNQILEAFVGITVFLSLLSLVFGLWLRMTPEVNSQPVSQAESQTIVLSDPNIISEIEEDDSLMQIAEKATILEATTQEATQEATTTEATDQETTAQNNKTLYVDSMGDTFNRNTGSDAIDDAVDIKSVSITQTDENVLKIAIETNGNFDLTDYSHAITLTITNAHGEKRTFVLQQHDGSKLEGEVDEFYNPVANRDVIISCCEGGEAMSVTFSNSSFTENGPLNGKIETFRLVTQDGIFTGDEMSFQITETIPAPQAEISEEKENFDAENWIADGLTAYENGDIGGAVDSLTNAINLDSENASAYYYRGFIEYWELEQKEMAIIDFEAVLKIDPDYASAYYHLGLAHFDLGNSEDAIRNLQIFLDSVSVQDDITRSAQEILDNLME